MTIVINHKINVNSMERTMKVYKSFSFHWIRVITINELESEWTPKHSETKLPQFFVQITSILLSSLNSTNQQTQKTINRFSTITHHFQTINPFTNIFPKHPNQNPIYIIHHPKWFVNMFVEYFSTFWNSLKNNFFGGASPFFCGIVLLGRFRLAFRSI